MPVGNRIVTPDSYLRIGTEYTSHLTIFNNSNVNSAQISLDGVNSFAVISPGLGYTWEDINIDVFYIRSFNAGNTCVIDYQAHGERNVLYPARQLAQGNENPIIPQTFVKLGK